MTVRRYTFVKMVDPDGHPSQDQGKAEWRETPDGKWVIYEDYASLESANRALTEENARLKAPVTNEEGKDAGLFDDGMTDGQLRSWMSKVNTQMLELILTTRPLDKPAWYVRLMTEEVQRRRLESRREQ